MDKKRIQKSLKIFTDRVRRRYSPSQVVLFGSYARGRATSYSDVDLVVVAQSFAKISKNKRLDAMYELSKDLQPDFHVFGLTPAEFASISKFTTLAESKQHGIHLL